MQMLISLKNNAALRLPKKRNGFRSMYNLHNYDQKSDGPSEEAISEHLKEIRREERADRLKSTVVLILYLFLLILIIVGVVNSFSNLNGD